MSIAWQSLLEEVSRTFKPMSSVVEVDIRKKDDVEEDNGDLGELTTKEGEVSQKEVPIPRPPPPFPQILVKKWKRVNAADLSLS